MNLSIRSGKQSSEVVLLLTKKIKRGLATTLLVRQCFVPQHCALAGVSHNEIFKRRDDSKRPHHLTI